MGSDITVNVGKLSEALAKELSEYTQAVAESVKAAADETAKEMLKNIKADAPVRTGEYRKSMKLKVKSETEYQKIITWYAKPPYGNLTALLEKGHAKRNGGRVKAYPHIFKNAEAAKQKFLEKVKEAIENGSE